MTVGTVEARNTRLFFAGRESSPAEILKVACPTGISGLGGPRPNNTITCLDSDEDEFKPGLKSPSQITVPFNLIPRSLSHQALHALDASGETVDWMVVLSDQADNPTTTATVDGEIHIVSPGPTSRRFQGFVVDITNEITVGGIVTGNLIIQRTGPIENDFPTPDLP